MKSKKTRIFFSCPSLRRHIGLGLSVCPSFCPSVFYTCTRSSTVRDRILKFGMWDEYENEEDPYFFLVDLIFI